MESFIIKLWAKAFDYFNKCSVFYVLSRRFPFLASYGGVDIWVLGHLMLSIILFITCSSPNLQWWDYIVIVYGATRVFGVVVYLFNVLLFDRYRAGKTGEVYKVLSYRRTLILALHNFFEIIFWFALTYRNINWAFNAVGIAPDSLLAYFNFSFLTMTTFGHSDILPTNEFSIFLTLVQSTIGLTMAILVLSRFISLVSSPRLHEDQPIE